MANPWSFTTLRPAFTGEDYYDTITIDGSGSIAAWTFEADLLDSSGNSVATPTVAIVDADARTVSVSIVGEDFTLPGDYTLIVRRTGDDVRTMVSWGTLEIVAIDAQLAWGKGF